MQKENSELNEKLKASLSECGELKKKLQSAEKELALVEQKLQLELKKKTPQSHGNLNILDAQPREQSGPSHIGDTNHSLDKNPFSSNMIHTKTFHAPHKSQHYIERKELNSNTASMTGIKEDYQRLQRVIKGQMKKCTIHIHVYLI